MSFFSSLPGRSAVGALSLLLASGACGSPEPEPEPEQYAFQQNKNSPNRSARCASIAKVDLTCDGIDDNCSGAIDDGWVGVACGVGACASLSQCSNGVEMPCVAGEPLATVDVTCDGVDDDCDGTEDEEWVGASCADCSCEAGAVLKAADAR